MSSGERLITYFVGRDEINPALNQINGGLSNTGRRMEQFSKQGAASATMLGREWQKFQRHFGYAMAGIGTYEIFNAISKLRDYQSELASLNAVLGTTPGELNKFGQAAIDISTRTAQPLNDVLASMQNIATSIPNMSNAARQHLIPTMALIESMGAKVAGTDPRSFGSTVLGLATAFVGRQAITNPKTAKTTLESIANKLITTQFSTPRVTGQDIATYIPMLAGGAVTSGFTLDQMLSLFTVGQRIIQRPATTAQYLRQLMIRLHAPTKAELPFFNQAGLDPQTLSQLNKSGGGMTILRTMLGHALTLGNNNLGGLTPEQFMAHGSWNRLQLSPEASTFIQHTIGGRIQSLVAARAITAGLQQIPLQMSNLKNAPSLDQRFKNMDLSMVQAQQALSNMTTEIGTTFMPAIGLLSSATTDLSKGVGTVTSALNNSKDYINAHTKSVPIVGGRLGSITEIAALAAAGLGGRALAKSSLVGRLFKRGSGLASGALAAEKGLLETQAASHALANQANGTPSSPFWVVIHPLSMSQIPLLAQKDFNGATKDSKGLGGSLKSDFAKAAGAAAALRGVITRIGARGLIAGAGAADFLTAETPALPDMVRILMGKDPFKRGSSSNALLNYYAGRSGLSSTQHSAVYGSYNHKISSAHAEAMLGTTGASAFVGALGTHSIPAGLVPYFTKYQAGKINGAQLNAAIAHYATNTARSVSRTGHPNTLQQAIIGMFRLGAGHQLQLSRSNTTHANDGYVEATLTLEPTQEFKNLLRPQQVKVHIPIGSGTPAPTSRGKARTARTK